MATSQRNVYRDRVNAGEGPVLIMPEGEESEEYYPEEGTGQESLEDEALLDESDRPVDGDGNLLDERAMPESEDDWPIDYRDGGGGYGPGGGGGGGQPPGPPPAAYQPPAPLPAAAAPPAALPAVDLPPGTPPSVVKAVDSIRVGRPDKKAVIEAAKDLTRRGQKMAAGKLVEIAGKQAAAAAAVGGRPPKIAERPVGRGATPSKPATPAKASGGSTFVRAPRPVVVRPRGVPVPPRRK